jgi:hypothetical protein
MADEKRDPAAELQAQTEAIAEGLRPLFDRVREMVDAFGRAGQAWLEQNRPLIEGLGRLAQDPAVRAYIEARQRGEIPAPEPYRPCHCLCGKRHPGEYVCDGEAVTTRRYVSDLTGPVDVALCAPCAVAQGIAELSPR